MLGVLAFKKSLFAGVLDGGDSAVFMNGTRLSKFMESVDEVTGAMGAAEDAAAMPVMGTQASALAAGSDSDPSQEATQPLGGLADLDTDILAPLGDAAAGTDLEPQTAPADPWAPLLEAGLQWVAALTEPLASADSPDVQRDRAPLITLDPATGERSLTLPLPDPATLRRLAEGLTGLLARLQRPR